MNYDKKTPFISNIKKRYPLTNQYSGKEVYHLEMDLEDSGIIYEPGDSVGILPKNPPEIVQNTLQALKAEGSTPLTCRHTEHEITLEIALSSYVNLTFPSKKLLSKLAQNQSSLEKTTSLEKTLSLSKEKLTEFLQQHEVWELLQEYPIKQLWDLQEFCNLLPPLLPRFYSIASSMQTVGKQLDLIVAHAQHETPKGIRFGLATDFLCKRAQIHKTSIPLYIQKSLRFRLPKDPTTPIIMIGPGTGVAPFRAFLQERLALNKKTQNWLFFGEWTADHHFFYKDYWESLVKKDALKLSTAFSRDGEQKVYVQHVLLQNAAEIWSWIEQGAYFYVCGDAKQMAKDVEKALLQIIKEEGLETEEESKKYIRCMIKEKRYLKDIY